MTAIDITGILEEGRQRLEQMDKEDVHDGPKELDDDEVEEDEENEGGGANERD